MERDERIFLAALGQLNQEVGLYVLRGLHEATGLGVTENTRPLSDFERELGTSLLHFGNRLLERSANREAISGQLLVTSTPNLPEVPR